MKKIIMCTLLVLFMCSCSQEKELITPEIPQQNTLPLNKTSLTLNYLQRDTLDFPNNIDDSRVVLHVIDGDTCVTVIGNNIIVGRRKGTAKVLVEYEDLSSIISVNVLTEEYIPVKELICNINGDEYKSGSFSVWQCCQLLNIKLKGVEPANATIQEVKDIVINSYDESGNLWWKAEDVSANIHGFSSVQKSGNIQDIDSITLRVFPRTGFMVNDSPCFMLSFDLSVWPKDLVMSDWDKYQLLKAFGDAENNSIRRSFIFNANENCVVASRDTYANNAKEGIYIRSGETQQLSAILDYPDEFCHQEFIYWNMDNLHNEYMNKGNLSISETGLLSLAASYNGDGYPYYNGLQQDTVYIGYIRANFLMTGSKQFSNFIEKYNCEENEGNMCYYNARHWVSKLQKEDKVDVYWIKN